MTGSSSITRMLPSSPLRYAVCGREAFAGGRFKDAVALFKAITTAGAFEPFLTIPAYRKLG